MARRILSALAAIPLCGLQSPPAIAMEVGAAGEQPNPYQGSSCQALARAATTLARRAGQAGGTRIATRSEGGELIVVWPSVVFSTSASGPKAAELARLKQDLISIEQASIDGQCPIQFDGPRPPGA